VPKKPSPQIKKDFCLHFDGKRISKHEYQVVCLTNSFRELKLGIVKCPSGSSQDIFNELKTLLDEFEPWGNLKMIICHNSC